MSKLIKKFGHAFRGLFLAIRKDKGVQQVLLFGSLGLLALHYFFGPFSFLANLVQLFCVSLVLITELQNSALETALDKVHPDRHDDIKRSKDIAAAAVLCAVVFSLVCAASIALGKI